MAYEGGCRCGACRYTLDQDALPVIYACHCLDCQTTGGSAFSLQAFVPRARFAITGELLDRSRPDSRDKVTTQYFCAACLTRHYSVNDGRPGAMLLRAGTLDRSGGIVPAVHMWAKRMQPWITLPPGAERHDEAVPQERIVAILAPNFA